MSVRPKESSVSPGGLDLLNLGSNPTTDAGKCSPPRLRRDRHHCLNRLKCLSYLFAILFVTPLCFAFRQDPIASGSHTRSNRNNLLGSQTNLVDDVQDGETSRLQRLLPSAWRNKNMSSWDMVESVRAFRGGARTVLDGVSFGVTVAPKANVTLAPPGALDKTVGKILTFFGKVVVLQSVVALLTSNDDALLTEVCVCLRRCSFLLLTLLCMLSD